MQADISYQAINVVFYVKTGSERKQAFTHVRRAGAEVHQVLVHKECIAY